MENRRPKCEKTFRVTDYSKLSDEEIKEILVQRVAKIYDYDNDNTESVENVVNAFFGFFFNLREIILECKNRGYDIRREHNITSNLDSILNSLDIKPSKD